MAAEIKLGERKYLVLPQPIGYLENRLGPELKKILEAEVSGAEGIREVTAKTHGVLSVFVTDFMPLWEFLGFESQTAFDADHYDREKDKSPSIPELTAAFKSISDVNGGGLLASLKAMLGPVISEKVIAAVVAALAQRTTGSTSEKSGSLPTSPPTSGGSDPTSSGGTPPTPLRPASAD